MHATRAVRTAALTAALLLAAGCTSQNHSSTATAQNAGSGGASTGSATVAAAPSTASSAASAPGTPPTSKAVSAAPGATAKPSASKPGATSTSKAAAPTSAPSSPALPGGCTSSAACGFPSAANTGTRLKTLTPHSGNMEVTTNGQVINGWDLTGSLDVYANNVTIVDSRITSKNWWAVNLRPGFTGLKVLHTTLVGTSTEGLDNGGADYGVSNNSNGSLEVGFCDISQFGAAVSTGHGEIHDNYTHNQAMFINLGHEWVHTDAIISSGDDTGGLTIRHNTLINEDPIDKGASASVGLFPDDGPVANTTVDDNWMAGGSYAFYGGDTGATGIKVTNNVFSTEINRNGGYYGFVAKWNASGAGNVWSGNHTPSGEPVVPQSP